MKSEFGNLSLGQEMDDVAGCEADDEVVFATEEQFKPCDDTMIDPHIERHLAHLMDTITRVGGEVCRLRAEVDGLLEQNQSLRLSFDRLRGVLSEKGELNMDDFELACDVVQSTMMDSGAHQKKFAN
jgi:hypothetical protein